MTELAETGRIGERGWSFSRWWHSLDRVMLGIALLLAVIGVLVHFGISPILGKKFSLSPYYFAFKHSVLSLAAFALMLGVSLLGATKLVRVGLFMMLVALPLMIVILINATPYLGARRWFDLGAFTLQPSEFVKPSFILLSAALLSQYVRHERSRVWLLAVLALYALVALLLLLQPDVGQFFLITVGLIAMWFVVGMSLTTMVMWGLALPLGAFALYRFLPHVADRMQNFMRFSSDLGETQSGQVYIGLNFLHEGGLLGKGLGIGNAAQRLFDPKSDFIFVVVGEQMGLLVALVIVVLYAVLALFVLKRVRRLNRPFPLLASTGLIMQISAQAWINMASTLGVIPPKGTTLPWISAGGSAILATGLAFGCLLSLTRSCEKTR